MSTAPLQAELERQRRLIGAIFAPQPGAAAHAGMRQQGARWTAGLAAYRGNGRMHARNALHVQFPTLLTMLGDAPFDALCARYWRACPPRRGDLAWVGEELPAFVATLDSLAEWPWLADCARLDWAIWQLAGTAPPRMTEDDLRRLTADDPANLALQLSSCTRYLSSTWPIVQIYQAHQQTDPDWAGLRQAIAHGQGQGQAAWLWRPQGNPAADVQIVALGDAAARWVAALAEERSIGDALDAAGANFDFSGWMRQALTEGWLDGVTAPARAGASGA